MSPRRSSRARTTQPPSTTQTTHSGSSSSVSSARTERATRTDHKQTSPQKSSTPHSLSSEEPEDLAQMDRPLTRRRTREQDVDDDDLTKLDDDLDDDLIEEDEVTRCVCGYQEYPGPPSDAAKSLEGDDLSGLFIQCDICKVWQHGGCVGIMDEAASPDEYFCEECRKDLHKVTTSPKGCVCSAMTARSVTAIRSSMLTFTTVKDTPATSPSMISNTARKPANRPFRRKPCPRRAATTIAIQDPASIRWANADLQ